MNRGLAVSIALWLIGSTVAAADPWADPIRGKERAVVKLTVTGHGANNKLKAAEAGSGFIVFSAQNEPYSFIVTAAHVVGPASDWLVQPDGITLDRTIKVEALDENGRLVFLGNAQVLEADDRRDVAVLVVQANKLPTFQMQKSGVFSGTGPIMVLGFPKDDTLPKYRPGTAQPKTDNRLGLALDIDFVVPPGMSGGPIVDAAGSVIGVASRNYPGNQPTAHTGTLAANVRPLLSNLFNTLGQSSDEPQVHQTPASSVVLVGRGGSTYVEVSGNGGGGLAAPQTAQAGFGQIGEVKGEGAEKSECDPNAGRTVSRAYARGQVEGTSTNALRFSANLSAQGGHYRTAATCVGQVPLGLTGHDTQSTALAVLDGELRFINERAGSSAKVVWDQMPAATTANISLHSPRGNMEALSTIANESSGNRSIVLAETGEYRLTARLTLGAQATGIDGRSSLIINSTLGVASSDLSAGSKSSR